jgi:hypothetical protein
LQQGLNQEDNSIISVSLFDAALAELLSTETRWHILYSSNSKHIFASNKKADLKIIFYEHIELTPYSERVVSRSDRNVEYT